jgi:RNA polymerase sigma-70 factor (ECF subfamily)
MDNNVNYAELVEQAQLGSQESMNRLAELVEGRLFAYIYRLTLKYDLTQDLLQETLLGMVKSLNELRDSNRFWAWLFRTALGNVQHHFREQRKRIAQMSTLDRKRLLKRIPKDFDDGLNSLIRKELSETILEAMTDLRLRHRSVLALRCFEQMPYSEIAPLMNCTELQVRVLFFRAKNSLKRQLSRNGFSKALLLTALGLFGLITAHVKAASATSTVSAASMEVGFAATVIGAACTKLGVAIIAAITTVVLGLTVESAICLVVLFFFVLLCLALLGLRNLYA